MKPEKCNNHHRLPPSNANEITNRSTLQSVHCNTNSSCSSSSCEMRLSKAITIRHRLKASSLTGDGYANHMVYKSDINRTEA